MYLPRRGKRANVAYANSRGSSEPAHSRRLARLAIRSHKKMKTFSQRTRHVPLLWGRACALKGQFDGKFWKPFSRDAAHIKALLMEKNQGPVVQSVVSLTSSLRVISLTVLADSIYNIMIIFAEIMWVAFALQNLLTFFQQKVSAYFNESLTNDIVSFEQLGPDI